MRKDKTPVTDSAGEDAVSTAPEAAEEAVEATQETASADATIDTATDAGHPLAEELEKARQEAAANLDGWQRARADFANYKKRTEREISDIREQALLDTLVKFLPVIDDFERAMENIPQDVKDNSWLDGVTLIQRKFAKILEDHAVITIDPTGEVFDPSRHEAIGVDDSSDYESGHVSATLQKGYACGSRILRPALVRVAG